MPDLSNNTVPVFKRSISLLGNYTEKINRCHNLAYNRNIQQHIVVVRTYL